jgi:hypothetical protein
VEAPLTEAPKRTEKSTQNVFYTGWRVARARALALRWQVSNFAPCSHFARAFRSRRTTVPTNYCNDVTSQRGEMELLEPEYRTGPWPAHSTRFVTKVTKRGTMPDSPTYHRNKNTNATLKHLSNRMHTLRIDMPALRACPSSLPAPLSDCLPLCPPRACSCWMSRTRSERRSRRSQKTQPRVRRTV